MNRLEKALKAAKAAAKGSRLKSYPVHSVEKAGRTTQADLADRGVVFLTHVAETWRKETAKVTVDKETGKEVTEYAVTAAEASAVLHEITRAIRPRVTYREGRSLAIRPAVWSVMHDKVKAEWNAVAAEPDKVRGIMFTRRVRSENKALNQVLRAGGVAKAEAVLSELAGRYVGISPDESVIRISSFLRASGAVETRKGKDGKQYTFVPQVKAAITAKLDGPRAKKLRGTISLSDLDRLYSSVFGQSWTAEEADEAEAAIDPEAATEAG